MNKVDYTEVFRNHAGFVSDKWVHYFFIYDHILSDKLRENKPVNLLEIGVQNGGSLEIWKKYLPEGSHIFGVDINPKCCELKFSENIHFHLGSAADNDFMNKVFKDVEFDIILDDGSHYSDEVVKTFKNMFAKIKHGGVYIIEDLCASYYSSGNFKGGFRKKRSSIEYFKQLVDAVNYDYIPKNKIFYRKQIAEIKKYSTLIKEISFYESVCAIHKYKGLKQEGMFQPLSTGTEQNVVVLGRKTVEEERQLVENVQSLF
jgi:SAM-dependent methyltransferase